MRHLRYSILLFLVMLAPVSAELDQLLSLQKRGDSGAYVSSGFHDWRTVSKYRSRPGLHAGYDIAMWAGSPVRAAWPGTVVAITPWYGSEYGVTIRSSNGYEATYGHISPSVSVGDPIVVGKVLGSVVVDHVDVKMRDAQGAYVDFQALDLNFPQSDKLATEGPRPEKLAEIKDELARLQGEFEEKKRAFEYGLLSRRELEALEARVKALRDVAGDLPFTPSKIEVQEAEEGRSKADDLIQRANISSQDLGRVQSKSPRLADLEV